MNPRMEQIYQIIKFSGEFRDQPFDFLNQLGAAFDSILSGKPPKKKNPKKTKAPQKRKNDIDNYMAPGVIWGGPYSPSVDIICRRFGGYSLETLTCSQPVPDYGNPLTAGSSSVKSRTTVYLVGASVVKNHFYDENKRETKITFLESQRNDALIDAFKELYHSEGTLESKVVNFTNKKYEAK